MSVPVTEFGNVNQCLSPQKNNDQYLTYVLVKIKCQVVRIGIRTDSQTIPRSHSFMRSVALPFTPRKGVIVSRCLLRQEKELSYRVVFYAKKRRNRHALPFKIRKGLLASYY